MYDIVAVYCLRIVAFLDNSGTWKPLNITAS